MTVAQETTQSDTSIRLQIRVTADLHRRVRVAAAQHDSNLQEFVTEALEERLAKLEASATARK